MHVWTSKWISNNTKQIGSIMFYTMSVSKEALNYSKSIIQSTNP